MHYIAKAFLFREAFLFEAWHFALSPLKSRKIDCPVTPHPLRVLFSFRVAGNQYSLQLAFREKHADNVTARIVYPGWLLVVVVGMAETARLPGYLDAGDM
jgi:hypothetical protein